MLDEPDAVAEPLPLLDPHRPTNQAAKVSLLPVFLIVLPQLPIALEKPREELEISLPGLLLVIIHAILLVLVPFPVVGAVLPGEEVLAGFQAALLRQIRGGPRLLLGGGRRPGLGGGRRRGEIDPGGQRSILFWRRIARPFDHFGRGLVGGSGGGLLLLLLPFPLLLPLGFRLLFLLGLFLECRRGAWPEGRVGVRVRVLVRATLPEGVEVENFVDAEALDGGIQVAKVHGVTGRTGNRKGAGGTLTALLRGEKIET